MVQVKKGYLVAAAMGVLVQVIGAQPTITATTCANPDGFTTCFQQPMQDHLVCSASAGSDTDSRLKCDCKLALAEIGCALESCWNVVYGCEYQSLAFSWDAYCLEPLGDIPFFPAPEHAPGGCSCNLGQILGNFTAVESFYTPCVQTSGAVNPCECCRIGGEITSIYSLCPNDDLSILGLSGTEQVLAVEASDPSACTPYFDQYDCVKDLGFPPIGTLSYLRALPSTKGTLSPSTTEGSITTPLYGSACVLTAGGGSTNITPLEAMTASNSAETGPPSQSSSSLATFLSATRPGRRACSFVSFHLLIVFAIAYLT